MIYFDHTFTVDPRHKFHKRLEKMGFILNDRQVEHPGGHQCRFIMIRNSGPPMKRFYLEFINIKPGGEIVPSPGVSFGYQGGLENLHHKFKRERKYKTDFVHRNYNWQPGDRSRQPGWNFLKFKSLGFRGLYPWVTEYEPAPGRKVVLPPLHPNGVIRHLGFDWDLNEKALKFMSYTLGKKIGQRTKLRDGTELFVTPSKRTRMNAVILKCKNIDRFISKYHADEEFEFANRRAARIINPSGMWDIIIV